MRRRWFPERQIILRERDGVRSIVLSPRKQMAFAGVAAASVVWLITATIGFGYNHHKVQVKQAVVDQTRLAYHDVLDEMASQHHKVMSITSDLEHYRSYLAALMEQNDDLQRDVRSFAKEMGKEEDEDRERQRFAAAEQALRGQLTVLERELVGVNERSDMLQVDVGIMRNRMISSADDRARFASARAVLDRRIGKLEQDLLIAQNHGIELEKTLVTKQQIIDQSQSARRIAQAERDQAVDKASQAENRMQTMAALHEQALNRLTEETRQSISEVERIVSATGLDTKQFLPPKTDSLKRNRGGPFVPWKDRAGEAQELYAPHVESSAALSSDLSRLNSLSGVLVSVPLASPLREYMLMSTFGYRVDPFNNKAAFHEGLDMQAPVHTKIAVTAPGKVISAGWNGAYGKMVEVDHGAGIHTRYGHMDEILVTEGQQLVTGQFVGLLGQTGRASGPHLHYEVVVNGRPRNPAPFLKARANVLQASKR